MQLLGAGTVNAQALSQADIDAIYNWPLWNPGDTCDTQPASVGSSNASIFILGDSITERTAGAYHQLLSQAGYTSITIDASAGRSLTTPGIDLGTDNDSASGLQAIKKDASQLQDAGTVVIGLGTNGNTTAANIDAAISAIKSEDASVQKIYWIDTMIVGRTVAPPNYWHVVIDPANQAIYGQANSQQYSVIPWAKLVDPAVNPTVLTGAERDPNHYIDKSDGLGVHPTSAGEIALASLVAKSVPSPTVGQNDSPGTYTVSTTSVQYMNAGRKIGATLYVPNDTQPHPLIMFAPGRFRDSTPTGLYGSYLKAIAAQGFVVAGADFSDNSTLSAVPQDANDIKFLIGQVERSSALQGKLNTVNGVGLLGHSDGAMIALMDGYAEGHKDSRITAVMAEDGAWYGGRFSSGPPLLMMHGLNDSIQPITSGSKPIYDNDNNGGYMALAEVVGADHYHYITQDEPGYAKYQPMVDTMTWAFFSRVLAGNGGDATNLKDLVANKYRALVKPFLERGSESAIVGASQIANAGSSFGQSCCPTSGVASFGPGQLPSYIPQPYNSIFTAAGNKYNVDPAVLVGIFYDENFGYQNAVSSFEQHQQRKPPPPYGNGAPWPVSPTGARGPFQFEPATWASYGVDGNGDGNTDPTDLIDAAFGAANYLGHLGATMPETQAKVAQAAGDYYGDQNPSGAYAVAAFTVFQKVKADEASGASSGAASATFTSGCQGIGTGASGVYQNPLRALKTIGAARIDQGVDYTGAGPIYALGDGKVDYASTSTGWPGGTFVSYVLSDGPAAGKRIYVAENCVNVQVHVGDNVTPSSILCYEVNAFPYIETGWADQGQFATSPVAAAHAAYANVPDGTATAYGQNFSDLLKLLGAPPGTYQYAYQQGGHNLVGTLPAGWPQW